MSFIIVMGRGNCCELDEIGEYKVLLNVISGIRVSIVFRHVEQLKMRM
jgi:hypothetical protein